MGSLLGGKKKSTTTSKTTVNMPGWLKGPQQEIVKRTMALLGEDYDPYIGQRIADFTPDELNAFQLTRDLVGQGNPLLQQAQGITGQVAQNAMNGPSQAGLDAWMNPYIQNVLDVNKQRQLQQYDINERDLRSQQAATGAFGGSRSALAQQQLLKNFNDQLSFNEQTGLANAYNQGLSGYMGGQQLAGQAAMNLTNQALGGQGAELKNIAALQSIGTSQRGLEQTGLDVNYQDFLTEQAYPYQQLQFGSGIVNPMAGMNAGSTNTQTTTQSGGSGFLGTALGLASMAMGIPGVGAALGGGLGSLAGGMGMGLGATSGIANAIGGQAGASFFNGAGFYGPFSNRFFKDGGLVQGYRNGGKVQGYQDGGLIPKIDNFMNALYQAKTRKDIDDLPFNIRIQELMKEMEQDQNQPSIEDIIEYSDLFPEEGTQAPLPSRKPLMNVPLPTRKPYSIKQAPNIKKGLGAMLDKYSEEDLMALILADHPAYSQLGFAEGGKVQHYDGGGVVDSFMKMKFPSPLNAFMSDEEIDEVPEGRLQDIIDGLAATGPIRWGNKVAEQTLEDPLTAAGLAMMALPAGRVAGKIGKPVLGAVMGGAKGAPKVAGLLKNKGIRDTALTLGGLGLLTRNKDGGAKALYDQQNLALAEAMKKNAGKTAKAQTPIQKAIMETINGSSGKGGSKTADKSNFLSTEGMVDLNERRQENKNKVNMPLMAFGAALLGSENGFFQALGEGAQAFAATKKQEEVEAMTKEEALRKHAMELMKFQNDVYRAQSGRMLAEAQMANVTGPYAQTLKQLKLEKLKADIKRGNKPNLNAMAQILNSGQASDEQSQAIIKAIMEQGQGSGDYAPDEEVTPDPVSWMNYIDSGE